MHGCTIMGEGASIVRVCSPGETSVDRSWPIGVGEMSVCYCLGVGYVGKPDMYSI